MSLYSHRHVKIRLKRRERLWSCVILFESLLKCWALLCGAQHRGNCLPTPASFFSKANLPLLQRELLHCARAAKQTPSQYLAQHEHLLLNTSIASPADSSELLMEVHGNGKRPSPER